MPISKGVAAPFLFSLHAPARRADASLAQAAQDFRDGRFADALIAAEALCREHPAATTPAVLRAKILQACRPTLATSAWTAAWSRDPLDAALQDQMLAAWLQAGAARRVADEGKAFLPQRCQAGTHASLLDLLKRAGVKRAGACWREADAIEIRCFDLENPAARIRVVLTTDDGEKICETQPGGALSLKVPSAAKVDSVFFQRGTALEGSPHLPLAPAPHPAPGPVEAGVDIIVPVYRDARGVQACLDSVLASLAHNRTPSRVIVVNDASPEPELVLWLEMLAGTGRITLLHNRFNLGFIETVNRALRPGRRNALLLNADTLVHGDWIDRMQAALESAADIASVMPWSNNGEIGTLVRGGAASTTPDAASMALIDTLAARLRQQGKTSDVEIPTSSGFAMLMRRSALDAIGVLDGASLTRGYLEEVEWCLRARAAGWRHLLASGVFVAHKGGASFGAEKQLRVRQNRAVVAARYPEYYREYAQFLKRDPMAAARTALLDSLQRAGSPWPPAEDTRREIIDAHAALPAAVRRVAVWQLRTGTQAAQQVLSLARRMASLPRGQAPRLLVFGEVSEALRHTGVVDPVIPAGTRDEVLTDATLASLAGCTELLAQPTARVPEGIACTRLGRGFDADAWLAARGALAPSRRAA
jgi:GT2 family glycosyltransferase